jgi:hypothetical protein
MNETDLKILIETLRKYLTCDASTLSKVATLSIIDNVMELEVDLETKDISLKNLNKENLTEAYRLVQSSSVVKGQLKPFFSAVKNNFREFMTENHLLQYENKRGEGDRVRASELNRYDAVLRSVCSDLPNKCEINGIETLALENKSREEALSRIADKLIIHYYKKRKNK